MEETIKIKVIVKQVNAKNGNSFKTYKLVKPNGELVELRWKKGNDLTKLDECKKAFVEIQTLSDASERFEYPRFYADGIISIEKIN